MRPVAFARYIALPVWLQRAAFMPPLRIARKIVIAAKPRAGHAPPLPGGEFWLLQYTVMVRRFRQVCRGRIYASRGVYPLYRVTGMAATGGIVAVPTDYP